jgi:hypothetical protein
VTATALMLRITVSPFLYDPDSHGRTWPSQLL